MRNTRIFLLTLIFGIFLFACGNKDKQEAPTAAEVTDADEWPEMDSFHMIMSESFHPYKDSANLEPVKRLAEEMAQEADKWAGQPLPAKVDNEEVKAKIQLLKTDTRNLADKIKAGASDEEVGVLLNSLHDSFHAIMEAWNGGGENHEHKH